MSIDVVCVNNGKYNVFVIKNDEYIGPCIARGFEWDGWMRQDVSMYYKSGTDILDIGANIGYNTLIFSEFGPVHSFEPVYHGIVNKNTEINETKHPIKVYNCALSNEQREDEIHLPSRGCQSETLLYSGGTSFHHAPDMKGVGVRVKCEKLDAIYEGTPSILKIDVEGHELQALEGAKETITQHKPMILIEIHDFTEDNEVHKFIKDLGYNDPITRPEAMFLYTSA
jgi:FkbM family methyltransferase